MKTILQIAILTLLSLQTLSQQKPISKISDLERWKITGKVSKLTQYVHDQDNTKPNKPLDKFYVKFIIHFDINGFITNIEQYYAGDDYDKKFYEYNYTYENDILITGTVKSMLLNEELARVTQKYQFINDSTYNINYHDETGLLYTFQYNLNPDLNLKAINVTTYDDHTGKIKDRYTTRGPAKPKDKIDLRNAYFTNKKVIERYPSGNEKVALYPSESEKSVVVKSFYEYYN